MYQILKTYFRVIFKLMLLEKKVGERSQMVLDPCESSLDFYLLFTGDSLKYFEKRHS